ncbi:unnamed protein product, partial [Ascophyllum nodosum]
MEALYVISNHCIFHCRISESLFPIYSLVFLPLST